MAIARANFIAGAAQIVAESLLHILPDLRLAMAGACQKDRCRRGLCTLDALRVVVGDLGGHLCHLQRFVQRVKQPACRRHPHRRAVAKAAVGLRMLRTQPSTKHPTVTGIGICLAQTPHFVLHLGKGFRCIPLPCHQAPCHRDCHDRIIGEVRFFAQQRKVLALVIVPVKLVGAAYHIAQNCSQHG